MLEEVHRLSFEERLGRLQTNLHVVLAGMQTIEAACASGSIPPSRTRARVESAAAVFAAELRTIHDLLYRPQQEPGEGALEGIVVGLAPACEELTLLMECAGGDGLSVALRRTLGSIARLGNEICGECVPRAYAPDLRIHMDRIQERARALPAAG